MRLNSPQQKKRLVAATLKGESLSENIIGFRDVEET
jgi:hypothetical protein